MKQNETVKPRVWLGFKKRKQWSRFRWIAYILLLAYLAWLGLIVGLTIRNDRTGQGILYDGMSTTPIPRYLLGWLVLIGAAVVVLSAFRLRASVKRVMAFILLSVVLTVLPFGLLLPYNNSWVEREYFYYHFEAPEGDSTLVVEEWQQEMKSGEVFYLMKDEDETSLRRIGKGNGGTDGFPAFANGQYQIKWEKNEVTIHWAIKDGAALTEGGTYSR